MSYQHLGPGAARSPLAAVASQAPAGQRQPHAEQVHAGLEEPSHHGAVPPRGGRSRARAAWDVTLSPPYLIDVSAPVLRATDVAVAWWHWWLAYQCGCRCTGAPRLRESAPLAATASSNCRRVWIPKADGRQRTIGVPTGRSASRYATGRQCFPAPGECIPTLRIRLVGTPLA